MPQLGRIAGLFIYPVKGCGGIELEAARLTARGFEHDRRWMIVDPSGRFRSQRELPQLATIRPQLADGELHLALGAQAKVRLPVRDAGEPLMVQVWRDQVLARTVDPDIDRTLSDFVGRPVRLVRFPDQTRRPCDPAYAPADSHTGFADGFPLLVTGEASLAELNEALLANGAAPVPMNRFRPNIILADIPAGAEDRHGCIELGAGLRLALVKPCDRCVVTTVDQQDGRKTGSEPLATLKRIRRNPATGGAWFGQNAVPQIGTDMEPTVRVGDACNLRAA